MSTNQSAETYTCRRGSVMSRAQLNVRVSDLLEQAIDKKRIDLSKKLGGIPSRSDVVRLALEAYLGIDLSEIETDGRRVKHEGQARSQETVTAARQSRRRRGIPNSTPSFHSGCELASVRSKCSLAFAASLSLSYSVDIKHYHPRDPRSRRLVLTLRHSNWHGVEPRLGR